MSSYEETSAMLADIIRDPNNDALWLRYVFWLYRNGCDGTAEHILGDLDHWKRLVADEILRWKPVLDELSAHSFPIE